MSHPTCHTLHVTPYMLCLLMVPMAGADTETGAQTLLLGAANFKTPHPKVILYPQPYWACPNSSLSFLSCRLQAQMY